MIEYTDGNTSTTCNKEPLNTYVLGQTYVDINCNILQMTPGTDGVSHTLNVTSSKAKFSTPKKF